MRNKCSYFPSISSTPSPTTLYSRTTPNPVIPRSHIHTHTHTHTAFIYINYTRTCTFLPLLFFFFLSGIMRVYYIIHIHILHYSNPCAAAAVFLSETHFPHETSWRSIAAARSQYNGPRIYTSATTVPENSTPDIVYNCTLHVYYSVCGQIQYDDVWEEVCGCAEGWWGGGGTRVGGSYIRTYGIVDNIL